MSNKTTAQVLREARALISDPERYGPHSVNTVGVAVSEFDPSAQTWNAVGALSCVAHASFTSYEVSRHLLADSFKSQRARKGSNHARILAAFDRAIELAEGDAS